MDNKQEFIVLAYTDLVLAILNNDLEQTKLLTTQLNELMIGSDITINVIDLDNLANQTSYNNSFKYFLLNFRPFNQTDKQFWYFLGGYLPKLYITKKITEQELKDYINYWLNDENMGVENKGLKYYTLVRFAMTMKDYDTVKLIQSKMREDLNEI